MTSKLKRVHVAVGVIYGADGRILVTQRAKNQHLGGLWEFPGGKLEPGETVNQALSRELFEELAIRPLSQLPLCRIVHNYPDKAVLLDVWQVTQFSGEPHPQEGQPLRWLNVGQLNPDDFPQANKAIIRCLNLPDFLAIFQLTANDNPDQEETDSLHSVINHAPPSSLLRLRQCNSGNGYQDQVLKVLSTFAPQCRETDTGFIIDLNEQDPDRPTYFSDFPDLTALIRGYHASSKTLSQLRARPVPDHLLFGASCHTLEEIRKAEYLEADYVLLSPVKSTPSHPGASTLGWQGLGTFCESTNLAVYALGGMAQADLATAQANGARGIAGISMFGKV